MSDVITMDTSEIAKRINYAQLLPSYMSYCTDLH